MYCSVLCDEKYKILQNQYQPTPTTNDRWLKIFSRYFVSTFFFFIRTLLYILSHNYQKKTSATTCIIVYLVYIQKIQKQNTKKKMNSFFSIHTIDKWWLWSIYCIYIYVCYVYNIFIGHTHLCVHFNVAGFMFCIIFIILYNITFTYTCLIVYKYIKT